VTAAAPPRPLKVAAASALVLAAAAALLGLPAATAAGPDVTGRTAVPRATCGPGSLPETGLQGQVPRADRVSGRALRGYSCNVQVVGREGSRAGYNVARYRHCAYYTGGILPGATVLTGDSAGPDVQGVLVVDVTDPAKPRRTAELTTPGTASPHESLRVHQGRGLLVATTGSPVTLGPVLDVYDVSGDCTQPRLLASLPMAGLGHEGEFSPDGKTFWSTGGVSLSAIDLTDPAVPVTLYADARPGTVHGLGLSDDGRTMYLTVPYGTTVPAGIDVLDVSAVQERAPVPIVKTVSRVTWPDVSVPQTAFPVTVRGKPYLIAIDEFGSGASIGAVTVLDLADAHQPRPVAKIKLEVHLPQNQEAVQDNDAGGGVYSAHNCAVPRRVDPEVLACGFLASGLRVFDIRDPLRAREVAYYNPPLPPTAQGSNLYGGWDNPAFVPERREVWFTNSESGFYVARLAPAAWPGAGAVPGAGTPAPPLAEAVAPPSAPPAAGPSLPATGSPSGTGALLLLLLAAGLALRPLRSADQR
jgi:hypothetical protein